jgi:hypothetical protein
MGRAEYLAAVMGPDHTAAPTTRNRRSYWPPGGVDFGATVNTGGSRDAPSVSGRPIPGDGTGIAAAPEGRLLRAQRCPDRGGGRGDVALPAGTPQEGFDTRLGEPAAQVGAGCHSEHRQRIPAARSVPNAARAAG